VLAIEFRQDRVDELAMDARRLSFNNPLVSPAGGSC